VPVLRKHGYIVHIKGATHALHALFFYGFEGFILKVREQYTVTGDNHAGE